MRKLTASILLAGTLASGLAQAENPHYAAAVQQMKHEMAAGIPAAGVVALDQLRPKQRNKSQRHHAGDANFAALPALSPAVIGNKTL